MLELYHLYSYVIFHFYVYRFVIESFVCRIKQRIHNKFKGLTGSMHGCVEI